MRAAAEDDVRTVITPMLATPSIEVESREAGWVVLSCTFRVERAAIGTCLGFGGDLEIIGPPALREQARRALAGAARLHGVLPTPG